MMNAVFVCDEGSDEKVVLNHLRLYVRKYTVEWAHLLVLYAVSSKCKHNNICLCSMELFLKFYQPELCVFTNMNTPQSKHCAARLGSLKKYNKKHKSIKTESCAMLLISSGFMLFTNTKPDRFWLTFFLHAMTAIDMLGQIGTIV